MCVESPLVFEVQVRIASVMGASRKEQDVNNYSIVEASLVRLHHYSSSLIQRTFLNDFNFNLREPVFLPTYLLFPHFATFHLHHSSRITNVRLSRLRIRTHHDLFTSDFFPRLAIFAFRNLSREHFVNFFTRCSSSTKWRQLQEIPRCWQLLSEILTTWKLTTKRLIRYVYGNRALSFANAN